MAVVLATPPFIAFYDSNGAPLSGGLIYTYAAGTTTPKATFTDSTGTVEMPNPIVLDSAGRATWWISGAYKYIVKDSLGNTIKTTDNVTSFNTLADSENAFFQSFSGDGTTTAFTLSQDLGSDEKGLMIFVDNGLQETVANGNFSTDTIWTKGAGWTIAAGVATATGAISTAISQTALVTLVAGQAYAVTYTITRSAGGLIPSVGGQSGTERTASGTYREVIVAGATQTLAFTGNAFTGTLDSVSITVADTAGFNILAPSAFTVNGTALTLSVAPAIGTNNIYVFAPSTLLGAASAAASLAQGYATAALASQVAAAASATSASGFSSAKNKWTFSSTTTMADPGTGFIRFNNATPASATAIAISDLSANATNPDVSAWILSWDDNTGTTVRGTLYIFKSESEFVFYNITGATTDNAGWSQLTVTYLTGAGTISNTDPVYIGFAAAGFTTVTGGITALTGDVTASGSGSVAATLATVTVNKGGTGATTLDANNVILGNGTSAVQFVAPGSSTNILQSNGTTWTSASGRGLAKASVSFNGTGTVAIRGTAYNVSSITDNGTGDYTVNFTSAFADANYAYFGTGRRNNATSRPLLLSQDSSATYNPSASALRFQTFCTEAAATEDALIFNVVAFGA